MKRFATCFFAMVLIAPSVYGAGASRVIPGTDTRATGTATRSVSTERKTSDASTISRSAISRNVNASPTTSSRSSVVSRISSVGNTSLSEIVNTVGRNTRVSDASINNNPTLRRAGVVLRPSTAEVGGRAKIAGTDTQTGSNIDEQIQTRASTKVATRDSMAQAKEFLEVNAELNKTCQEQYNDCMDQFCNVIDANQGRCSCSANLSKYTKSEEAVKNANTELNDVAQRIRYVGLSADEIRAIMNATEAEEELSGKTDTTETRNMLEEIEELIKDPKVATTYSDTYTGLDMNLDFSAEASDIFSLEFLNLGTTTNSFSNLRGRELYNAAKRRCNTILNQCKEAGATSNQITGNYDLAIDKDCIAYEKGLRKMNETLVSNVRSAERMLQKARLAVLQNKNQYDAKACVSALDNCMRDEMVCGEKYYKCVDPTKIYIDENGKVVLGQNITNITEFMVNYNNAAIDSGFLQESLKTSINETNCKADATADKHGDDGICVVRYLMEKIGTGEKVTDNGLCRPVLEKCQRYTYTDKGKYKPYNDVVLNYVQRAMTNIRSAQQSIISEYASSCMLDVATCYNQQVTQVNAWTSSASIDSIYKVMRGACRNVALTCGYAIFAGPPELSSGSVCTPASGETTEGAYVTCISEMFYESLLCPDNSAYTATAGTAGASGYVNAHCVCLTGYEPWGTQCLRVCDPNAKRNPNGICVCNSSYKDVNGVCQLISD